jgi:4a-hydroxytetrahydrobiopterin dehydratase
MKLLKEDELILFLEQTPGWKRNGNSIEKEFILSDFTNALTFIMKCGFIAEKMDHHPDMLLYSWNKVRITICTHSLGGITENDLNLAKQIDKIN